jgi:hypothetical protein
MMRYFCCDEQRRADVRDHATLNGIDFLEVMDEGVAPDLRQRELRIHFVKHPPAMPLAKENVRITGGVRVKNIEVVDPPTPIGDYVQIIVNAYGDFSIYTLTLEGTDHKPLPNMDMLMSSVDFSFKVECPTDLDCESEEDCPPDAAQPPEIDYLAKDYESFRRIMLERMSVVAPEWRERNPADLGIVLVEMLAYVADQLSYEQDAVATEAYLGMARRRASVRRHARLLDYHMHDGCNARVWVQVKVDQDATLPAGTPLLTRVGIAADRLEPGTTELREALAFNPVVFETMHEAELYTNYERLPFYTWGSRECALPQGATKATLTGKLDHLEKGQVLVFVEERGPRTGEPEDADPGHRHAVRLTAVDRDGVDTLYNQPVTQIEWDVEDALPFPLCISATTDEAHGRRYLPEVSAAQGNIVLADHGSSVKDEELAPVPAEDRRLARVVTGGSQCDPSEPEPWPPRYRPQLALAPLTMVAAVSKTEVVDGRRQRMSFDPSAPAGAAIGLGAETAVPSIWLLDGSGREWRPRRDLLASDEFAPEFVTETDDQGRASLRFGDDVYGMRPASETAFSATYRVGNGLAGNVGANSIAHIVSADAKLSSATNPMPASGGTDPQTLARVKEDAPRAFRVQQRAVTPADYAEVAQRRRQVQRAAARLRWTGSWQTVFLSIDRAGGLDVDQDFEAGLRDYMERFRMAGHDIEVDNPSFVPLEIELFVCIEPQYYRSDVKSELLRVLSNRAFPDGLRGIFHPDRFSFGQPVYLSPIYAAAQAIEGVASVEVRKFQRLLFPSRQGLDEGQLDMGPLEIARLDNDPSLPENGSLHIEVEGGR